MKHRILLLVSALVCLPAASATAGAPPTGAEQQLQEAAAALTAGKTDQALRQLEALADTGVTHPDVSFTRGVAYLRRGRSAAGKAGDLGQAAAAFRETLVFRPNDAEAERGLEEARIAAARRSSKVTEHDGDTLGLGMRILLALDPWVLAIVALLGSLSVSLGLMARRWGSSTARTAGTIAIGVGLIAGVPSAALYYGSVVASTSSTTAVVVATRAPLLDEAGRTMEGVAPLREGTEVRIRPSSGHLVELVMPEGKAWLRRHQLRVLAVQ